MACHDFVDICEAIALPTSFQLIPLTEEQRVISRNLRHDHSFYFSAYNKTCVPDSSEIGREDISHGSIDIASRVKSSDASNADCQSDNVYESLLLNIGRPCDTEDQRIQRYSEIRSAFSKFAVSKCAVNVERGTSDSNKSGSDHTSRNRSEDSSKCDDFVWTVEVTSDRAPRAHNAKKLGRPLRSQRKQLRCRTKHTRPTRQKLLQSSKFQEQDERKTLRKIRKHKRRKRPEADKKMKEKLRMKRILQNAKNSTLAALNTSERDLEQSGRVFVARLNAVRNIMRTESVDEAFDAVLARLTQSPELLSSLISPVGDVDESKPSVSHCTLSKREETTAELSSATNSSLVASSKRVSILVAKLQSCAADEGIQRATSVVQSTSSHIALAGTSSAGRNNITLISVRKKEPIAVESQSTLTSTSTSVQFERTGVQTRRKPICTSSSTPRSAYEFPIKTLCDRKLQKKSVLSSNDAKQCSNSVDFGIGAPAPDRRSDRPSQVLLNVSNFDGQFDQDEYYNDCVELERNKENESPVRTPAVGSNSDSNVTTLHQSESRNTTLPVQSDNDNPVLLTVSSPTSALQSSCVRSTFCTHGRIQAAYNTRARASARTMCQCSQQASDSLKQLDNSTMKHLVSLPESKRRSVKATGVNLADRDENSMIEMPRMRVASTCIIKQSEAYLDPVVMDTTSQSLCSSVDEPLEMAEDEQCLRHDASRFSSDSAPNRSPVVLPRLTRSDFQIPERSVGRNSRFRVSSQSVIFRSDAFPTTFIHNSNQAAQSSGFLHPDAVQCLAQSNPFSTPTTKDCVDENANVRRPNRQNAQSSGAKSTGNQTRKRKSEAELLLLSASLNDTPKASATLSRDDRKAQSWMRAFEKVEQGSVRRQPTRRLTYMHSVPDSGSDSESNSAPIRHVNLLHLADSLDSVTYLGERVEMTAVGREPQYGDLACQSLVAPCVYMTATLRVVVPECQTFFIAPYTPEQCQFETVPSHTTLDTASLHSVCILRHALNEVTKSGPEALHNVSTDTQRKAVKSILQVDNVNGLHSSLNNEMNDKWKSPMGAYQNRAQKMAQLAARKSKQQLPSENETSNSAADCRVGSSSKPVAAAKRSDRNPATSGARAVAKRATRSQSKRSDSVASAFGSSFRNGSATQNSNRPFSELGTILQNDVGVVASRPKQSNLALQSKSTLTNGLFQQSPAADVVCRKRKVAVQSHVPDVPAKKPHEDPERKRQMQGADELGEIIADDRCDCVSHAHNLYDGRLLSRAERQRLIEKWLTDADVIESTRHVVEWQLNASAAPSESAC